jgi:carbon monoxide dehydrogenase subunit G
VQLEHSFGVPVGIDEAWKILLDIERIGPCMPGAVIDSVDGDNFTGTVKVKLGPINLTYKGKASFVEKDETAHRAVIDARGRDARGNGTAAAVVTATLAEADGTTRVHVTTDLDITGKPAQFGRGVMVDVGNKLINQFADALAGILGGADAPVAARQSASTPRTARPRPVKATQTLAPVEDDTAAEPAEETMPAPVDAGEATPAYAAPGGNPVTSEAVSSVRAVNGHQLEAQREVEPINLMQHAGPAVAKRLAPVAVALVVVVAALRRRAGKRA